MDAGARGCKRRGRAVFGMATISSACMMWGFEGPYDAQELSDEGMCRQAGFKNPSPNPAACASKDITSLGTSPSVGTVFGCVCSTPTSYPDIDLIIALRFVEYESSISFLLSARNVRLAGASEYRRLPGPWPMYCRVAAAPQDATDAPARTKFEQPHVEALQSSKKFKLLLVPET